MNYMSASEAAQKWGMTIESVRNLCKEEMIAGAVKEGGKWKIPVGAEKPVVQTGKKITYNKVIAAAIVAVLYAILGGVAQQISGKIIDLFSPISIISYSVMPYDWSETATDKYPLSSEEINHPYGNEFSTGFMAISFINNTRSRPARITDNYLDILDIKPVNEPNVFFTAVLTDDLEFVIYAINDGFGDAYGIKVDRIIFEPERGLKGYDCSKLLSVIDVDYEFDLKSRDIFAFARYKVNRSELSKIEDGIIVPTVECEESIKQKSWLSLGFITIEDNNAYLDTWGVGGPIDDTDISVVTGLDVDKRKPGDRIRYDVLDSVEYNRRFNLTIFPSRSCELTYALVYCIGKQEYRTPSFTVKVTTSAYSGLPKETLKSFAERGVYNSDKAAKEDLRILESYRYNYSNTVNYFEQNSKM